MVADAAPGIVALVGGECTGKTTLAQALAVGLPAVNVPEALRTFVATKGRVPDQAEQTDVLASQIAAEEQAVADAREEGIAWAVSDSGALMTAVYSALYYDDYDLMAPAIERSRTYHLTVWCDDDFGWLPDEGQRDGVHQRRAAQRLIGEVLVASGLRWIKVSGAVAARTQLVQAALGLPG